MKPVLFEIDDLLAAKPGATRPEVLALARWNNDERCSIDVQGEAWLKWWGDGPLPRISEATKAKREAQRLAILKERGDDTPGTPFFDTAICRSQKNCELCRDPEKGKLWRQQQLKKYPEPRARNNFFKCLYGKPWKYRHPRRGPLKLGELPQPIVIEHNQGLGDAVMLTGAIRDLQQQFPGKFNIAVQCGRPEVFWFNPHIEGAIGAKPKRVKVECYPGEYSDDSGHFLYHFHRRLGAALGVDIRPGKLAGDIHLAEHELAEPPPQGPYWVIFSRGGTSAKDYDPADMQMVVDSLKGKVRFIQVGKFDGTLRGATDAGRTDIRALIRLVYHADGVVAPISGGMHLAAAVPVKPGMPPRRPAVVFGGGREPANFAAYPGHTFLSAVGQLPCCATGGCWRWRTGEGGDCVAWHKHNGHAIADCMKVPQLAPQRIVEAVLGHQSVIDDWHKKHPRGIGDVVARVTSAIGVKPCGGCRKRAETLNKLVPFNA